jgi:hypothetical protein
MKKNVYTIMVFMVIAHFCFGRAKNILADTLKADPVFLYILNFSDGSSVVTKNAFIDPQRTTSWYHLSDSASKEVCKLLKVDMVYVIKLMPGTRVLTLNELFDFYGIAYKFRKLSIRVDDDVISYPETILISRNQIDNVKVVNGTKGQFIRIILKGYFGVKKELEEEHKRREKEPVWDNLIVLQSS